MKGQTANRKERALQLVAGVAIIGGAVAALFLIVFAVLGSFDYVSLQLWAALATLLVPAVAYASWWLTSRYAEEHVKGFERGVSNVETTLGAIGRQAAAARAANRASDVRAGDPRNDDLLGPRNDFKLIDAPKDKDVIDY